MPVAVPPAAHTQCGDYKTVDLFAEATATSSPDCDWKVVSLGDDDRTADIRLGLPVATKIGGYNAFVVNQHTHKTIYSFVMEHTASVHWLKDGRFLIINEHGGPGENSRPLVFVLGKRQTEQPIDLSAIVVPNALRRSNMHQNRTYTYVDYLKDRDRDITLSVDLVPFDRAAGMQTMGIEKCYIYSVDKATFRHYTFIKEVDASNCPTNPDEH